MLILDFVGAPTGARVGIIAPPARKRRGQKNNFEEVMKLSWLQDNK